MMFLDPASMRNVLEAFRDPDHEPVIAQYASHLRALAEIIRNSGDLLEGNLFAEHQREEIFDDPAPIFKNKRRNYAWFCASGSRILEVGFNAGHSCLLALTINKNLAYTGVDIGVHSYTKPCFDYLQSVFGDRVMLHIGDSRDVLPYINANGESFDLFHLDGGHGFDVAHADLCNMLEIGRAGGTMLVDDVNDAIIGGLCDLYIMRGRLSPIKLSKLWSATYDHAFYRMHPSPVA